MVIPEAIDATLLEAALFGLGVGVGAVLGLGALEYLRSRYRHIFGEDGRERNDDFDGHGPSH